ncbi:hypothetical protein AYO49_05835 [Verrucomicrobiaceae bacterium SCGC AG-212-N21]|nr:hypothetical protein AYO49_05835 [Verrucomicrobiaceae bacterium SCGC AG-212-N21]
MDALIAKDFSMSAACRECRVAPVNYERWKKLLDEGGEEALQANYANCGRPPKWELTKEEAKALRGLVLIRDSQAFAIEEFARFNEECRPETKEAILREVDTAAREKRFTRWPASLRRAVAITVEERAQFRGAKHFGAVSFAPRKGLFFTNEKGERVTLYPHTVWTMDDYSTNEPYIVETEEGGTRLCRQVLECMDVASDAWLGVEMIGRERDAYRAEDILRFILRCIDGQGTMPLYLLLERGRWESQAVHGLDLEKQLGAKFKGRKWGGLDHLFGIIHGFTARHKACLESSNRILQRALAHSGREIGTYASEFEDSTKAYLAVQAGRRDPKREGFLAIEAARDWHWKAMQYLNGRGKHRAATGTVEVPNDLLAMWDAELDARRLPENERWRFNPVKRLCSVRQGFIEMTVQPYKQPFRFQINGTESGLYLSNGYRVLAAFDPAMPALGAHVCHGEPGTLNREGLAIGEFLMTAPHAEDVPQFDLRAGGYGDSSKRKASTAARTAFAAINPMGRRGLAVDARHDGRGDAVISRTGVVRPEDGLTGTGGQRGDAEMGRRGDADGSQSRDVRDSTPTRGAGLDLEEIERRADEHFAVM